MKEKVMYYIVQTKSGRVYAISQTIAKSAISAVRKVVRLGEVVTTWFPGDSIPMNAEVL